MTPEGRAKVLDFGLARTDEGGQSSSGGLDSPTMTTPHPQHSPTIAGAILGTAAYMSPEQARGRRVDKRTDIWSFGVVLYEMLMGSCPFVGETASDSIGAVLHKEFNFYQLPEQTPQNVRRVLERCLERNRDLRFRDIGDARLELLRPETPGSTGSIVPSRISVGLLVGLGVLIAFIAGAAAWIGKPATPVVPGKTVHSMVRLPDEIEPASWPQPDLSDDGRRLAMRVERENETMIADGPELRVIPGTEYSGHPAFSPDGEWLLYGYRSGVYKRLIAGGPSIQICDVESMRGLVWENDNSIVLSPRRIGPLHRVSESGGVPEPMYEMDGPQTLSDRHPHMLPGGRGVLFQRCEGDNAD